MIIFNCITMMLINHIFNMHSHSFLKIIVLYFIYVKDWTNFFLPFF